MSGRYEPTAGDGRYARLYLADLEPRPDTVASHPVHLLQFAIELDQALTNGERAVATLLVRKIRACARAATTDKDGES